MSPESAPRPAPAPAAAPVAGPAGFIDVIAERRIAGWVWDPTRKDRRFDVEVRIDGKPVAKVKADRLRKDLESSGVGDGHYGFEARHEMLLGEDDRHRVTAFAEPGDGGAPVALANHTVRAQRTGTLKPEDVAAIRSAIEAWPGERRVQHDQLLQYLKAVAGELQRLRGAVDVGAKDGEDGVPAPSVALEGVAAALGEVRQMQDELNRRMLEIDAFHGRFDNALAEIEKGRIESAAPSDDAGLRRLVLVLGAISVASLLVGLASLVF